MGTVRHCFIGVELAAVRNREQGARSAGRGPTGRLVCLLNANPSAP